MAWLSGSPLLCRAAKSILLFNGSVTCWRFCEALGQVPIRTTATRNECAQPDKKMVAFLEKWEQSLVGGEGCQGTVVPGRAEVLQPGRSCWWPRDASPCSTVTKVLWLRSKGKMPLWFHSAQEEIKHGVFPLRSAFVRNELCSRATCWVLGLPYSYLLAWRLGSN